MKTETPKTPQQLMQQIREFIGLPSDGVESRDLVASVTQQLSTTINAHVRLCRKEAHTMDVIMSGVAGPLTLAAGILEIDMDRREPGEISQRISEDYVWLAACIGATKVLWQQHWDHVNEMRDRDPLVEVLEMMRRVRGPELDPVLEGELNKSIAQQLGSLS